MRTSRTIGDHAALGDGRTAALVTRDGTVDWLCLPDLDATPVFGELLDGELGGCFELAPIAKGYARRRYVPGTNVLETTWDVPGGQARVTDALMGGPGRSSGERSPLLIRRIEGMSGRVRMGWLVAPRFGEGQSRPRKVVQDGDAVRFDGAGLTLSLTGPPCLLVGPDAAGDVVVDAGEMRVLALAYGPEPAGGEEALLELEATIAAWRAWTDGLSYDGPWRDAVLRSALTLRLLVHETSGALSAAATLGLPEQPGGERNYDYRYCWLRDSSFVIDAFGHLGDRTTNDAYLRWMTGAIEQTTPVLQPFYRLDGGTRAPQRETALAGYGGARPVRIGNDAFEQRQLGSCGDVLQSCALHLEHGGRLPKGLPQLLIAAIDHVASHWHEDDAGIWEITPPRAHTWSKMACWVALTRGADLTERGQLLGSAVRWRDEAERVREHIEREHWSEERQAYVAIAGEDGLDAAVLLGVLMDYPPADPDRWTATIAAIDDELGRGPLLFRTSALKDREQLFLPCAFWRAHALTRLGRTDEARAAIDTLVGLANDLGLLSEEIDADGSLWGNVPQALTHAAFVNAAVIYHHTTSEVAA